MSRLIPVIVCTTSRAHYLRIEQGLSDGNFTVAMASSIEEANALIETAIFRSRRDSAPIVILPEVLANGKRTAKLLEGMLKCQQHVHVILADPSAPWNFRAYSEIPEDKRVRAMIARPPEAPAIIEMIRGIAC